MICTIRDCVNNINRQCKRRTLTSVSGRILNMDIIVSECRDNEPVPKRQPLTQMLVMGEDDGEI